MARTEDERLEHYAAPKDLKQLTPVEALGADMEEAVNLLDEGIALKEMIENETRRYDEIKDKLLALSVAHDLNGFRNGTVGFTGTYVKGRRTLSKELLLENQVTPEQIAASYKEGDASWRREIKRLG